MLDNGLKQRVQVFARAIEHERRPAIAARRINRREVQLLVGSIERHEQLKHFIEHFIWTRGWAINLVQNYDGA